MKIVYRDGQIITSTELRQDIEAGRKKGLSNAWAFTPETVEALLDTIDQLIKCNQEEIEVKEQFADVKVGDRVWSINHGWGAVSNVCDIIFDVQFKSSIWYTLDGMETYLPSHSQTLFWDEVIIIPPPKPQGVVATHSIGEWANVYADGEMFTYPDKSATDADKRPGRVLCFEIGEVTKPKRKVTHEIERWVNAYPSRSATASHDNKEDANYHAAPSRIACVKLTGTYETMED